MRNVKTPPKDDAEWRNLHERIIIIIMTLLNHQRRFGYLGSQKETLGFRGWEARRNAERALKRTGGRAS